LRTRIKQLQDDDPTGQFVKQCHAIEEKLKAFQNQIGQTVDQPGAQQTAFPTTRNETKQDINPHLAFLGITGSQCTQSDASNGKDN
jgi:hypothetical protein